VLCLVETGTTLYESLRRAATDRPIWRGSVSAADCRISRVRYQPGDQFWGKK